MGLNTRSGGESINAGTHTARANQVNHYIKGTTMTNEQMQIVTNAVIAKHNGISGAREIYNLLWDQFHCDEDFDSAVESAENEEIWS